MRCCIPPFPVPAGLDRIAGAEPRRGPRTANLVTDRYRIALPIWLGDLRSYLRASARHSGPDRQNGAPKLPLFTSACLTTPAELARVRSRLVGLQRLRRWWSATQRVGVPKEGHDWVDKPGAISPTSSRISLGFPSSPGQKTCDTRSVSPSLRA